MVVPGLDLYCTDPARTLTAAGKELVYVDGLGNGPVEVWISLPREIS